jgi:tRNA pseudouridine55 synthase
VKERTPADGVLLLDKPAGYSSTRALSRAKRLLAASKAGHTGTLDPFATGLLLLLSGASTRLQPRFVGLPKRYETAVDLTARTSTGDVEGEVVDRHDPPTREELVQTLDDMRGAVDLPVPAVSAVKIEGQRAYALHRRGVAVEMPVRTMHVNELVLVGYADGVARLELHVSSGTYVRAIAEALGGHCVELRRTEIGPFSVGEADPDLIIPPDDALARIQ